MIELHKLICSHKPRCEFQTIVWGDDAWQETMLACRYCGKVVSDSGDEKLTPFLATQTEVKG